MTQKTIFIGCCLFVLSLSACSQTETSKSGATTTPAASSNSAPGETTGKALPADVVRAETANVEIKPGGSAEALVKLTVAGGYHINANPPSFSYLKATELNVEPNEGLTPGKPIYPSSITRKFAFSKDPLAVYEGQTEIKVPLSAAGNAQKGAQTLKARLRIQPCDEEACYPPRTIETSIPVTIK
jgi:hypothetical protein